MRIHKNSFYYCFQDLFFKLDRLGNGIGKCPYNPDDNSTAIWVASGNPGSSPALYTATTADFLGTDSLINRQNIRTRMSYLLTLANPHFVGSFETTDYVYFFFRETAAENLNDGKVTYSRIARVCKNDAGGSGKWKNKWTTFLKAWVFSCLVKNVIIIKCSYFQSITASFYLKIIILNLFFNLVYHRSAEAIFMKCL